MRETRAAALVECVDVTVEFDGARALDGVSLAFAPGEVVGVVGANGAGKSTLGRVIVGELPYDTFQGELRVEGELVRFRSARDAHHSGIVLIHQERAAVPELSIGENVMLAIEPRGRFATIDWRELHRRADDSLRTVGVEVDTRMTLSEATGHVQHLIEVARAFASGGRVLVFDESTAALGIDEVRTLLRRMSELRDRGASVLFISHRLDEVLEVSDRVVVLRDGRVALDARRHEVDHDEIVRAMLGTDYREFESVAPAAAETTPTLALRAWTVPATPIRKLAVGPVDVDVREGEVLGVFGPLGAGKTELLASVFGLFGDEPGGELLLDGRRMRIQHPARALELGIVLIPSERRRDGIVSGQTVRDNIVISSPAGATRHGILLHAAVYDLCRTYVQSLGIKLASVDEPIDNLSGGNQQKVLLARAMTTRPRLLMLDEPTRGIDVGAKVDVYRLIRRLADEGTSFVLASMEADEVLRVCDRIAVLRDGRQIALLEGDTTSEHELVRLSTGGG